MFERFTDRARQVVVYAQDEARELRHNYIGTEHLLLGLLRVEGGGAHDVLGSLGITIEEVRAQVGRIIGEGDEPAVGQIPFTPRAKKVLELSLREAVGLGHTHIGTEHILLGIARENEGVAARILREFGCGPEVVREAVVAAIGGPAVRRAGPMPLWRRRREKFRALAHARDEALEQGDYELARKLLELEIEARERAKAEPPPGEMETGAA